MCFYSFLLGKEARVVLAWTDVTVRTIYFKYIFLIFMLFFVDTMNKFKGLSCYNSPFNNNSSCKYDKEEIWCHKVFFKFKQAAMYRKSIPRHNQKQ